MPMDITIPMKDLGLNVLKYTLSVMGGKWLLCLLLPNLMGFNPT